MYHVIKVTDLMWPPLIQFFESIIVIAVQWYLLPSSNV